MKARAHVTVHSPFLLEPEAAAYLRVSMRTLRSWRADGRQKGPRFRYHGGVVVYAVVDLDKFSEQHATKTTRSTDVAEDREATASH